MGGIGFIGGKYYDIPKAEYAVKERFFYGSIPHTVKLRFIGGLVEYTFRNNDAFICYGEPGGFNDHPFPECINYWYHQANQDKVIVGHDSRSNDGRCYYQAYDERQEVPDLRRTGVVNGLFGFHCVVLTIKNNYCTLIIKSIFVVPELLILLIVDG